MGQGCLVSLHIQWPDAPLPIAQPIKHLQKEGDQQLVISALQWGLPGSLGSKSPHGLSEGPLNARVLSPILYGDQFLGTC